MPRHASRERAERVVMSRAVLRTPWREIMRAEGFRSVGAVQNTYYRELARRKLPPKALADMTSREIMERRDATTRMAVDQLMDARRAGDTSGMAMMIREIRQNDVETAKLLGLYEPERVEVTVSAPAAAIIDQAERELLALMANRPGFQQIAAAPAAPVVIDAEVIG
jgi:hypothetical protein